MVIRRDIEKLIEVRGVDFVDVHYRELNAKQSSKSREMSPVSMENIALFVPA